MKQILITIVLTATVTALLTYFTTRPESKTSDHPKISDVSNAAYIITDTATLDTESLQTAQACVKNFNKTWDSLFTPKSDTGAPIRAFTIHSRDMVAALGLPRLTNCRYANIRVYLGLTSNNTFKLYIVGADSSACQMCAGADHFFDVNGDTVSIDIMPEKGQWVMDLVAPCPATCDQNSPLNYNNPVSEKKVK